ncbi:methylenetetrahydrofolate--tRNA-(uracil(54)-C(5))-methyltransferase (FADH(2)-oxidizing) TrmFO [Clostridia bacterium]|nr:methylenetetrahydrofolate--tRNA-(uracil(54)-C(5))-methyltransferase (FADH(2)-oxidizing) TrmFO [Clostridia bacterium]
MITIIGAGLAGCECAYQLISRGIAVTLVEMKPHKRTPAHKSDAFGELVCSNSLRGNGLTQAAGLLKAEMRELNSLILQAADAHRVRAGGALAVERGAFADHITAVMESSPLVTIRREEATEIPSEGTVVVATGPLTSDALAADIARLTGAEFLSFYDAAAPILSADSIDLEVAYLGDRYGQGVDGGDYLNCPMNKEEYLAFRAALAEAEQAPVHGFEDTKVFEGCMPVEVLARRGEDTLRFGPLKPIGLRDPRTGQGAYAVVQLRRENDEGTMFNIVGFQNHLTFGEQKRVFTMIPALKNAEFLRYGVMHRNTFINSPRLLNEAYQLIGEPRIYFAGQLTGVEGYVESAASGLTVGLGIAFGKPLKLPPQTAIGALSRHVSANEGLNDFQPMNINFGILPKLDYHVKDKRERYAIVAKNALDALNDWKKENL